MELKYLVDPETFDKTLNEESREIAALIDTLKDMALVDKRAGIPTILEFDRELQDLYPRRKELDDKLRELKELLSNPEEHFLDRELELNDEQELLRTKKDIEELERQRTRYENEKQPYLRRQESYNKSIEYNQSEADRLSGLNNDDFKDAINTYYGIIAEDQQQLESTLEAIHKYDNLIADVNRKLIPLNKKKDDLEKKLQSKLGYIDNIKKTEVEKEYDRVIAELMNIDVAIGNISNHPVYLAATARIPLKSAGTEILKNIIKQLADLARRVPHMDTPTSDIAQLDEEKARLIKERDRAYREKQNSNGLVKPLETRIDSFSYGEEEFVSSINQWLEKTQDKRNSLIAETKKVLEDKNRLAEELNYRRNLNAEDVKPEILKETSTLEEVKSSYDKAYDSYIDEITLYQKLIDALNNILNSELTTLKTSYDSNLTEELQTTLDNLKEHKISFLGTKSRIDKEVEELMMEVVGIDHRKKFSSSPSEIEEDLNNKLNAIQAKFDEQMHTFFAPEPPAPTIETHEENPIQTVDEVPVIDLQSDEYVASPIEEDFGEKTQNADEVPVVDTSKYVSEPVGEFFGEPEIVPDSMVATGEIPVFNPVDKPQSEIPDLDSGEPLKVTDVQELDIKSEEEKDRQADFTTIIPQDAPVSDEKVDYSELDRILNGSVGRGR